MPVHELIGLERDAWRALASSGEEAAAFYEGVLAERVVMLLPGGLVLDDRAQAIDSMRGVPWDWFELSDERVVPLTEESAAVVYGARAQRGETRYQALFNSTYVREGGAWRLLLHQQTPV